VLENYYQMKNFIELGFSQASPSMWRINYRFHLRSVVSVVKDSLTILITVFGFSLFVLSNTQTEQDEIACKALAIYFVYVIIIVGAISIALLIYFVIIIAAYAAKRKAKEEAALASETSGTTR
ncbi:20566_t:CDS:2, partial [Dentiscutata erythropus]